MRITGTLADDVYQAAKTLADASGKTLGGVLSELAQKGLQPQQPHALQGELPVFAVPPNPEAIPGAKAAELLADEAAE